MRYSISPIIVLSLTVLLLSACTEDYRGSVGGQVRALELSIYGEATPAPLPDVLITAKSLKNGHKTDGNTNSDGDYRLDDAQFGLNKVKAEKDGYTEIEKYADVEKDRVTKLNFLMHKIPLTSEVNLTFIINNTAVVPVQGAVVDLFYFERGDYSYTDSIETYLGSAYSDAKGHAVFIGIATIPEFTIQQFRGYIVAVGYETDIVEFALSYGKSDKELHVTLTPVQ